MRVQNMAYLALILALPALAAAAQQHNRSTTAGAPIAGDWPFYNGNLDASRYSSLRQINRHNVASLREVARAQLPETTGFVASPLVIGTRLFVSTPERTYAFDATTGKLLWSYDSHPKSAGLGTGNRGAAYANGRIYRGTPDGRLIALDAGTGRPLWDVQAFDPAKGEYVVAAPIIWRDKIYIGSAGSDIGAIGHVKAFGLAHGRQIWSFANVPASGPGSDSWSSDPTHVRAGGGVYSSLALDPSDGMLYAPVGNPGPDFAGAYRPGRNLYTVSVVRLDARTGALKGYHQFVQHDIHDWDISASPMLFTSRDGRRMVAVAGKNGYLYALDRDLSRVDFQVPVTTIQNADASLTAAGTRFCPGTQGGVNWYGPAYSPQQNAIYVDSIDWCTVIKLAPAGSFQHEYGKPFLGSTNAFGDSDPQHKSGWIYAVDADNGKVLWRYHATRPMVASLTPTAGGLVFTGDLAGNLLAFDAASGRVLLKTPASGPIGGGIVTYMVDGRQYVAAASGMKDAIMETQSGPAAVVIYALPSASARTTPVASSTRPAASSR